MSASSQVNPVVLLGAGASVEAGIPASFELTNRLLATENRFPGGLGAAFNYVCATLMAHDAAIDGTSPLVGLDVERVIAAVDLLAERDSLEVTPFVASWQAAVEAYDRPSTDMMWDRTFTDSIVGNRFNRSPSGLIRELLARRGRSGSVSTYTNLRQRLVAQLVSLLVPTQDVSYLRPLADAALRPGGLTVATLNYDLALELAARETTGLTPYTGVQEWSTSARWDWPDDGLRLLKLHGSIGWAWRRDNGGWGQMNAERVAVLTDDDADPETGQIKNPNPALVFGHRQKLSAVGPFLSLLQEFEQLLARSQELFVLGYSFRDDHINEVITRWLADDQNRKIEIVDPGFKVDRGFRGTLHASLVPSPGVPNPFTPRLEVFEETASAGIARRFGVSPPSASDATSARA